MAPLEVTSSPELRPLTVPQSNSWTVTDEFTIQHYRHAVNQQLVIPKYYRHAVNWPLVIPKHYCHARIWLYQSLLNTTVRLWTDHWSLPDILVSLSSLAWLLHCYIDNSLSKKSVFTFSANLNHSRERYSRSSRVYNKAKLQSQCV